MDELKLIEYKPQKNRKSIIFLILGVLLLISITFLTNKPLLEGGFEELKIGTKEMITRVFALPSISDYGIKNDTSGLCHNIDGKVVCELCNPVNDTWTDEIKHYKNCTQCYNQTIQVKPDSKIIDSKIILNENGTYDKIIEQCYNYLCVDYFEYIEHINEQVDCIKNGKIQVEETIYGDADNFAVLKGTKVCLQSYEEGGQYAIDWRDDDSVDIACHDILTGEITVKGSSDFKKKTTETLTILKTKVELDVVSIK